MDCNSTSSCRRRLQETSADTPKHTGGVAAALPNQAEQSNGCTLHIPSCRTEIS
jgi:hypothetical protein